MGGDQAKDNVDGGPISSGAVGEILGRECTAVAREKAQRKPLVRWYQGHPCSLTHSADEYRLLNNYWQHCCRSTGIFQSASAVHFYASAKFKSQIT